MIFINQRKLVLKAKSSEDGIGLRKAHLFMCVYITVRVGDRQHDPVNILEEVLLRDVNNQSVDGVEGRRKGHPLASV